MIDQTYEDQVVTKTKAIPGGDIIWRNGVYKRIMDFMDADATWSLCDDFEKKRESKMRKMKIAIWTLSGTTFILLNILLSVLIWANY